MMAWMSIGRWVAKTSKIARGVTVEHEGLMEEMETQRATFLRRGLALLVGKEGKEVVGADRSQPRVTYWREDEKVAEATAAEKNLTMVKVGRGVNKR